MAAAKHFNKQDSVLSFSKQLSDEGKQSTPPKKQISENKQTPLKELHKIMS